MHQTPNLYQVLKELVSSPAPAVSAPKALTNNTPGSNLNLSDPTIHTDETVSAHEGVSPATTIREAVSVSEGVSHMHTSNHINKKASTSPSHTAVSVSVHVMHPLWPQYAIQHGSESYRAFKQWHGIDGHIYLLMSPIVSRLDANTTMPMNSYTASPHSYPQVFSAFIDLPVFFTEAPFRLF